MRDRSLRRRAERAFALIGAILAVVLVLWLVSGMRLGEEHGNLVIVLDGLSPGELIVTKGSFVLKSEMERGKIETGP